ncbi:putative Ferredoxin--NAD(+) reductase [Bradyrhizobium sp. ORS 285]|uniref:2Fe-2S iron-sulfur cluster-binding protein n=2 Tax=unclassified Bradyrhizobium TaxID=2631580 RepID=UPI0002408A1A|nr:2Fe-2S iron-sulfur cluster-binding protein [Bradyrhizobium sp. ORS 285]CCD88052.1 putative Ferredoxin--NAD(+) reductase [Bradyrhizobium sp. ORS 285]SMX59707.1 putative Ferredoxin--NAD(+) reductase [Bradyrhizobium sp. ORS 285]
MSNFRTVTVKGRQFRVRAGDVLLDGALANGVEIPFDCRAGTCGTCMVHVAKGQTVCGETHTQGMIYACQARVVSDLDVDVEDVPEIDISKARLVGLREVAPDIMELMIAPEKSISYLPGQYFKFTFAGYPARAYSPTASFDGRIGGRVIHLNIKKVRGGRVTQALGSGIRPGHRLRIQGPYGHAFLRPGGTGRLVLAGSGTGFAPIWAIAAMALRENRSRPMVIIAGAKKLPQLYMTPILAQLARLPNVAIVPTVEEGPINHPSIRTGRIEPHMPTLTASDVVYACGSPRMVTALAGMVEKAGATFYADPFDSAPHEAPSGIIGRIKTLVARRPAEPEPSRDSGKGHDASLDPFARALSLVPKDPIEDDMVLPRTAEPRRSTSAERDHALSLVRERALGEAGQLQERPRRAAGQMASGHV